MSDPLGLDAAREQLRQLVEVMSDQSATRAADRCQCTWRAPGGGDDCLSRMTQEDFLCDFCRREHDQSKPWGYAQ